MARWFRRSRNASPEWERLSRRARALLALDDTFLAADLDPTTVIRLDHGCPPATSFPLILPDNKLLTRADALGRVDVRRAFAERLQADDACITHGGTASFAAFCETFINPGDVVVTWSPMSPMIRQILTHHRARVRVLQTPTENGRVRLSSRELPMAVRGAKAIVLVDPGTPHGATFAPEERELLAFWAAKVDALVYVDASWERWMMPSAAPWRALPGMQKRLLIGFGMGPAYGLPGLGIGTLLGPSALITAAGLTMRTTVAPPAGCMQRAAVDALGTLADVTAFDALRAWFGERLSAMGLKCDPAAGGWFLRVMLNEPGQAFAERLLIRQRVAVLPGIVFDGSDTHAIRVSLCASHAELTEALQRLAINAQN